MTAPPARLSRLAIASLFLALPPAYTAIWFAATVARPVAGETIFLPAFCVTIFTPPSVVCGLSVLEVTRPAGPMRGGRLALVGLAVAAFPVVFWFAVIGVAIVRGLARAAGA